MCSPQALPGRAGRVSIWWGPRSSAVWPMSYLAQPVSGAGSGRAAGGLGTMSWPVGVSAGSAPVRVGGQDDPPAGFPMVGEPVVVAFPLGVEPFDLDVAAGVAEEPFGNVHHPVATRDRVDLLLRLARPVRCHGRAGDGRRLGRRVGDGLPCRGRWRLGGGGRAGLAARPDRRRGCQRAGGGRCGAVCVGADLHAGRGRRVRRCRAWQGCRVCERLRCCCGHGGGPDKGSGTCLDRAREVAEEAFPRSAADLRRGRGEHGGGQCGPEQPGERAGGCCRVAGLKGFVQPRVDLPGGRQPIREGATGDSDEEQRCAGQQSDSYDAGTDGSHHPDHRLVSLLRRPGRVDDVRGAQRLVYPATSGSAERNTRGSRRRTDGKPGGWPAAANSRSQALTLSNAQVTMGGETVRVLASWRRLASASFAAVAAGVFGAVHRRVGAAVSSAGVPGWPRPCWLIAPAPRRSVNCGVRPCDAADTGGVDRLRRAGLGRFWPQPGRPGGGSPRRSAASRPAW